MFQKRFALCSAAALLAVAVACSKSPQSPASPAATVDVSGDAAPDGSTLKVTAPRPQSPVNSAVVETVVLVAGTSTAQYPGVTLPPLAYEFEVKNGAGTTICAATVTSSGSTATAAPACTITPDTAYTWIVRASLGTAKSSWSAPATFRTPAAPTGGYITGNEIFDPLVDGKTIGRPTGSVTFTPDGLRLNEQTSHVRYQFPQPLLVGEFSVMVKGADEGSAGDKTKIFSMQQGDDGDITTNSYRFTAELRGRNYVLPGTISCRMITGGDNLLDCARAQLTFDSNRWYFWKLIWDNGGSFTLSVRLDGPKGAVIYSLTHPMYGRPYRPTPHNLYLGSPIGRGGPIDATMPGGVYKNLWVSAKPRPQFPGE